MLDKFRSYAQTKAAQVILALVLVPFALFGIDSYLNQAGNNLSIAKVDGYKIALPEYNRAIENVRNRMMSEGKKVDPAMFDSFEFKESVVDGLITKQLINNDIKKSQFKITDQQLSQYIIGMPDFQKDGKFSQELYDKVLQNNQLNPKKFEESIRNDLLIQQVRDGLQKLTFIPPNNLTETLKATSQQREVTVAEFKTKEYMAKANISEKDMQAFYDQNKSKFLAPEQVKAEFVVFSLTSILPSITVSEDEVKAFYKTNADKYQNQQQREASHILIAASKNAAPAEKAKAKAKAEDVLGQIKKNPKQFEELATKYSQDPESAKKGGDLGAFGRGMMVKPFDDAVFSMKVNEISGIVESDFGYHIIKLTKVIGEGGGFDAIKPQIKAELIYQKAQDKYAALAEDFSNKVYEQSSSLDMVSKKFNLPIQKTDWISRNESDKFFKNEALMNALYSKESIKDRRNTEAIEVTPNNLISARVVDYKAQSTKPFAEVKKSIEDYLKFEAAKKLVATEGESALKSVADASRKIDWQVTVLVDRKNTKGLSQAVTNHAYKMPTDKLPSYSGFVDGNNGYVIVKVSKVAFPNDDNEENKKEFASSYTEALSSEYLSAYLKGLKAKSSVSVNQKFFEATQKN
ncbi:peptidylprolyl isomerase [Candidatus Methylopumilus universalis]|uniref:Periplasmic chaperone PpiD n=1 Tax=Candidatus Methylopumilus universalis TaxID=2588536 RepID=A0AAX1F013_9PROT|nr:SurA N-terminal domain-containing protein [Candidatus Methylopumilus universalis]QDC41180.1 peptidylprolyl isomerase [Candidatus Methylopumilus universalis]QDC42470.1 peptidylprolyl isomerase [Candidatus Methylopumilus universalis]QDC54856.1 peptidylprolyl isomerase [Candidatus Methylopumilus universalis]QDC56137.1 peptidylprolyl isomerase [Candidatus Methylopumilus universalis]QDC57419.1 peptidylprolyl isomerase [Candidatus Methylopumilus universalis]